MPAGQPRNSACRRLRSAASDCPYPGCIFPEYLRWTGWAIFGDVVGTARSTRLARR